MSWPLSQDYNEALQDPGTAFADAELRRGEVVSNALGLPAPRSGNFADVYQVRCPGGAAWAVKCFTREVPGLRERYAHIDAHLRKANLPFSVGFRFLEQGVRVRGRWYPLLKMQWVEGLTLNEFLRDYRGQAPLLDALAQIWVRMARRLREARVAHGDLQHGNVLLVPGGKPSSLGVRLIDYDGMYVPALADRPSGEVGHPAYQHPARLREKAYGPDVDCFPHLVIYTALRALRAGAPSLWQRYDTGDNLLFRARDFAEPGASPLLKELWLSPDEELHHLAGHLVLGCQRELGRIAWLDALVIDGETTPLTQRQQRHVAETLGVAAPAAVTVAAAPPGAAAAPDPWADIDAAAPPPAGKPPRRHREQPAEKRGLLVAAIAGGVLAAGAVVGLVLALGGGGAAEGEPVAPPPVEVAGPANPPRGTAPTPPGNRGEPQPPAPSVPAGDPPPNPGGNAVAAVPWEGPAPDAPLAEYRYMPLQLAFTADGRQLAATQSGTIFLYSPLDGRLIKEVKVGGRYAPKIALFPGGLAVVQSFPDPTFRVWDLAAAREVRRFHDGPRKSFTNLLPHPNGREFIAFRTDDNMVEVFDFPAGKHLRTIAVDGAVWLMGAALSPDGKLLAVGTAGQDQPPRLYDYETGRELRTFRVEPEPPPGLSLAFSPDSARLLVVHPDRLRLWDVPTGRELHRFPPSGPVNGPHWVAFAGPDHAVAVTLGGELTILPASGGEPLQTVRTVGRLQEFALSPDGRHAAVAGVRDDNNYVFQIWRLVPGGAAPPLAGSPAPEGAKFGEQVPVAYAGKVRRAAFSPDGRFLVAAGEDLILRVFETATGEELRRIGEGPLSPVFAVCAGDRVLVQSAAPKSLRLYDLGTGRFVRTLADDIGRGFSALVPAPDGRTVLAAEEFGVASFDLDTGRRLSGFPLPGTLRSARTFALSPDGRQVLIGTARAALELRDPGTGRAVRPFPRHPGEILAAVFSPDGERALSCGEGGEIFLWDVATGRELRRLRTRSRWVYSVAFCPDGRRAVSFDGERRLQLWDLETGAELAAADYLSPLGGTANDQEVLISPDGTVVAVFGMGPLALWRLEPGGAMAVPSPPAPVPPAPVPPAPPAPAEKPGPVRTFAGPDGAVNDVAFSPDGRYVAAACSNRKVFVFDRDSGEVKGRLELPKVDYQIVGVGFRTPAELILVSDDGKVVIRDWAREANLMSVPLILPGRNAKLAAHAFSAAGDIIAVGGPGTPAYVIFPKSKQASARTLAGGGGGLNGVAISAGGTMVLVSGADARVRVYAFPGGNLLRNLSAEGNDPARAAVFSPDDSRVAAILGSQRVQVWDLRTAERVRSLGHAVHPEFYDLAFTPDGGRLVTVNSFGTLKVWDVESEKPVYESPPSAVAGSQMGPLALSPDGRFAVTGSDRGEVRLWRLPDAD